jgi:RNA polymerase sigma-70 factor (ECF subfamily)
MSSGLDLAVDRPAVMKETRETRDGQVSRLLEKARSGDLQAFRTVVAAHERKVFLLAYSLLRNREDALDVVQETFLRLYQKMDAFAQGRNFQSWLLQIAKNLAIDYYRKNTSRRREHETQSSLDDLDPAAPPDESNPKRLEVREALSRGLSRIGERQRLVFVMKHYNGLDYREIAEVLRISVGTVKSLHFKAVRNLRGYLGPQLGILP